MDVLSAIATRRSIGKVKEDPVPSELIHQILEAGTWAPSHAIWRTGESCYSNEVKELFKLSSQSEMVGLLYIGYPDMKEMKGKRKAISEVTTWFENKEDFA